MTASNCVIISLHNHPSLSKFSLQDVQFLIMYASIKMMCVVTNLGSISYLVKSKKYNRNTAMEILKSALKTHNDSDELKGYQKAAKYFLRTCHKAGIIYEDGNKEATDMINYPKVSLGESLEASRAAAWIRESEAREIECREL